MQEGENCPLKSNLQKHNFPTAGRRTKGDIRTYHGGITNMYFVYTMCVPLFYRVYMFIKGPGSSAGIATD